MVETQNSPESTRLNLRESYLPAFGRKSIDPDGIACQRHSHGVEWWQRPLTTEPVHLDPGSSWIGAPRIRSKTLTGLKKRNHQSTVRQERVQSLLGAQSLIGRKQRVFGLTSEL